MVGERLLHREPEPPLQALDPLDDSLDVDVEVGKRPVQLLEPAVDVVSVGGPGSRFVCSLPHHITLDVKSL